MERERDGVLAAARWGLLAWQEEGAPRLAPHPFWSDGAGLWLALPAGGDEARGLRAQPQCAVWVPPIDGSGPGVAVSGRARVFGLDDPWGLVVHAPVVSTAVLALASRSPDLVLDQARRLASLPPRLPGKRSIGRVAILRLRGVEPPQDPPGMAPPLPPAIPADVRRQLSGTHSAGVALLRAGAVAVAPVSLGAGFRLTSDEPLPAGARVAVGLVPGWGDGPAPAAGVVLDGTLQPGPALRVEGARWWMGGHGGSGAVPASAGGVVLPD